MGRLEKLLDGLDLAHSRGIEIGPLASPVVRKDQSEVLYVDRCDRDALVAHYAPQGVDTSQIVAVDAIWGEQTLRECLSDAGLFDYAMASHVVEHVPDLVGWLYELAEILRVGGRLGLVIPDKRFTFDYLRQPTRMNEVVDAYLRRNRRPSPAQIFDHHANVAAVSNVEAWRGPINPASLKLLGSPRGALAHSLASIRDGLYVDSHCWVFTPRSILDLFMQLVDLDLMPFALEAFHETERDGLEMVMVLRKVVPPNSDDARATIRATFQRADVPDTTPGPASAIKPEPHVDPAQDIIQALRDEITALRGSRSWRAAVVLQRMKRRLVG